MMTVERRRITDLFRDGFLHLEKRVESSRFDSLQQGGGDVHVRIQSLFSGGQFGESSDGSLQIRCVRREIAGDAKSRSAVIEGDRECGEHLREVVDISHTSRTSDFGRISFISTQQRSAVNTRERSGTTYLLSSRSISSAT